MRRYRLNYRRFLIVYLHSNINAAFPGYGIPLLNLNFDECIHLLYLIYKNCEMFRKNNNHNSALHLGDVGLLKVVRLLLCIH